jgi:hypothetical protein
MPIPNAAMKRRYAITCTTAWNQTSPGKLNNRILMAPKGKNMTKASDARTP